MRECSSSTSFNPRLPGGKAISAVEDEAAPSLFQSTPSGGEGERFRLSVASRNAVSIHAFRGGRRNMWVRLLLQRGKFQSTPSGGEGDWQTFPDWYKMPFQSTPSGGEGDCVDEPSSNAFFRFNPRLPGGKASTSACTAQAGAGFQSTPSGGEGDLYAVCPFVYRNVSIHAFRGGRRRMKRRPRCRRYGFNPRLPGGKAIMFSATLITRLWFQSTPSGGEGDAISRAAVPCSRQIL